MSQQQNLENLRTSLEEMKTADDYSLLGQALADTVALPDAEASEKATKEIAKALDKKLDKKTKDAMIRQWGGTASSVGKPSRPARDFIWIITISAIAVVVVVTAVFLATGLKSNSVTETRTFTENLTNIETGAVTESVTTSSQGPLIKSEILLSVLTLAVGFLSGVFAPSPVADKQNQANSGGTGQD